MSFKQTLRNHLIAGETQKVFRALTVLADQIGDNGLMNDVVHQHARYTQLERDRQSGRYDEKTLRHRRRQIEQVLMMIVERMPV